MGAKEGEMHQYSNREGSPKAAEQHSQQPVGDMEAIMEAIIVEEATAIMEEAVIMVEEAIMEEAIIMLGTIITDDLSSASSIASPACAQRNNLQD